MVTYTQLRPFVYQINFSFCHNSQTIIEELNKSDWEPWNLIEAQQAPSLSTRSILNPDNIAILSDAVEYFSNPAGYKTDILKELFKQQQFEKIWAIDYETLMRNTTNVLLLYKDGPGFVAPIHLDNRQLVTSGMITFSDHDDPDISTFFYTSKNKDDPLRVPIGHGQGWTAAVTHTTWHAGGNYSTTDRYSLYFAVGLKLVF
jgi:hypothetical protein